MTEHQRPFFLRRFHLPLEGAFTRTLGTFSPFERVLFALLFALFLGSSVLILQQLNRSLSDEVPAQGGTHIEGVVGSPRFINPLLAISEADRDLTELVYASLMRATPEGVLVPEIAEQYTVSESGLVYTFTLRDDVVFHDGTPLTADDVVFTIARAQDAALKSPKRANWDGVAVEKIGPYEVQFLLEKPYAPFLENTTLGILPKHIWENADADEFPFSVFNTEPIGAGPFKIDSLRRDQAGIPTHFTLTPHSAYPEDIYLGALIFKFYQNEAALIEALNKGEVDAAHSVEPQALAEVNKSGKEIYTTPLPRIFGVFFNQNKNEIFADQRIREALDIAIDREALIDAALSGYGAPVSGPFPPTLGIEEETTVLTSDRASEAAAILDARGWTLNEERGLRTKGEDDAERPLTFTLTTANIPELKRAAEHLGEVWRALGIEVQIKIFEPSDLNQNVIRPRSYEALLFGEVIGRELDLFAFWHSSQRNDPGLNIAQYASISADSILEDARTTQSREERIELFKAFAEEIKTETPALFLYAPEFIYITSDRLKGIELGTLTNGAERFLEVPKWYVETEYVWTFIH